MNKTLLSAILFALCFCSSASGQTRPPKAVSIQPPPRVSLQPAPSRAVLGFTFGEPLKNIDSRCEDRDRVGYTDRYLYLCTVGSGTVDSQGFYTDGYLTINYPKAYTLFYNDEPHITAKIIGGKLESMSWDTSGFFGEEQAMLTLKEKFGRPTKEHRFDTPLAYGKTGLRAEWKFSDLEVTYLSVFLSSQKGHITIETPASKEAAAREKQKPTAPIYKM